MSIRTVENGNQNIADSCFNPHSTYQQASGRPQDSYCNQRQETNTVGICAVVFGALGGWLGLIFSIIGLSTYKTPERRMMCKIGLGLFIGWFAICLMACLIFVGLSV